MQFTELPYSIRNVASLFSALPDAPTFVIPLFEVQIDDSDWGASPATYWEIRKAKIPPISNQEHHEDFHRTAFEALPYSF